MSPLLVVILGVLTGIGIGVLANWYIDRLCVRDRECRVAEARLERNRLVAELLRSPCAMHGHNYRSFLVSGGVTWVCQNELCGEFVSVPDEDQGKDGAA